MTTAERITALINNPRSPFEEADRAYLATLTEERIGAAEAKAAEPPQDAGAAAAAAAAATAAATTAAAGAGGTADADTVTVSASELASLRALAAERDRTRNAQKRVLVSKLKTAQTTYTEQRLNAMELETLQEVAALLQLDAPPTGTDFVALERDPEPVAAVEPPQPWTLALAKRNGTAN